MVVSNSSRTVKEEFGGQYKHSGFYSVIVDTIYFAKNPIFLINFLKNLMKMFKHKMKELARSSVFKVALIILKESINAKNPMCYSLRILKLWYPINQ